RLDKSGAGTGVKVYRMRFGDARQVAALLNNMFAGGSGSAADSSTNQLAPGGGAPPGGGRSNNGAAPLVAGSQTRPGLGNSSSFNTRYADASGGNLASGGGLAPGSADSPVSNGRMDSHGPGGAILPGVRIMADPNNNALLIYANQENYRI